MDSTVTIEQTLKNNGSLVYTNVGVSMRPLIREGRDVIQIKSADGEIKKYDAVLFVRPHISGRGHYVLHRVLKINKDGTYWIVGDNCTSGEIIDRENIIGVLTAVVRNGKTLTLDRFSYRMYVAFWCAPYPLRFFLLGIPRFAKRVIGKIRRTFRGNR